MSEIIHTPTGHEDLWVALSDPEYRQGYSFGFSRDFISTQIGALRSHRGWTQGDLAAKANVSQPQISKWENGCDGVRLDSLQRLADAFDVALVVKFVPFSELARTELNKPADKIVPSFDEDSLHAIRFEHRPAKYTPPLRPSFRSSATKAEYFTTYDNSFGSVSSAAV